MPVVLGLLALVMVAVFAMMDGTAFAAIPPPGDGRRRYSLSGLGGLPGGDAELNLLFRVADETGADLELLGALRKVENGGPGRELGVLSVSAPTIEDQYTVAARTIRNTMNRYTANTGQNPYSVGGRLSHDFLRYFSSGGPGYPGYAPIGASNDPAGLNHNHYPNLVAWYDRIFLVES